jgi:plastocyanin
MKAIITIIVLAIIAWAGYAMFNNDEVLTETDTNTNNGGQTYLTPASLPNTSTSTAATSTSSTPTVKEFTVTGSNFSFNPSNLTVNKGDRVRIIFKNSGGNHDWVIDEFGARTSVLSSGQSQTVEFTADKAGSFEYYCSVGTHRQMGMKGTLTVK